MRASLLRLTSGQNSSISSSSVEVAFVRWSIASFEITQKSSQWHNTMSYRVYAILKSLPISSLYLKKKPNCYLIYSSKLFPYWRSSIDKNHQSWTDEAPRHYTIFAIGCSRLSFQYSVNNSLKNLHYLTK